MKWFLVVAFVLVNAIMFGAAVPGAHLAAAADGGTWYEPAVALWQHGAFVDLNDPSKPQIYRGPVFPIFGAAVMFMSGTAAPESIVVAQIFLLLLAGLVFRRMVEDICPGWGTLGFALFVFNPNALATAHLVQSDTLFLFFMTVAAWAALRYLTRDFTLGYGIATGAVLGIACLTRPTPQFLLLALPLALPILAVAARRSAIAGRAALTGVGGVAAAAGIMLPWLLYVYAVTGGIEISSSHAKYRFLWDQVQVMEAQFSGTSQWVASQKIEGPGGVMAQYVEAQGESWTMLTEDERYDRLTVFGYKTLLSYPSAAIARALAQSVGQFLLGAGAGNFHNLLGTTTESLSTIWLTQASGNPFETVRLMLTGMPLSVYLISAVAYAFVAVVRLTALVGLAALVLRRQWALLLLLSLTIAYFALVHVFVGTARYRLATEPELLLLAVIGIETVASRLRRQTAQKSLRL